MTGYQNIKIFMKKQYKYIGKNHDTIIDLREQRIFINEISEDEKVCVSFGRPKRIGNGDYAWVDSRDLEEVTKKEK